uniref:Xaa-Pro dipeptidyl-peptidase C-terminal domain-containing protein n=1 Tax=Spongospora subterranea TaxID=70186 RepID=A0A0H5R9T1_9EUKA|eukprot:CRZ10890.1 hypothetical protein [Spongospora subterranea]
MFTTLIIAISSTAAIASICYYVISRPVQKPAHISRFMRIIDRLVGWIFGETLTILNVPIVYDNGVVNIGDHVLNHVRYWPESLTASPMPCILIRSPYGGGIAALTASRFSSRGYCVIVQDCRGRHHGRASDDEFIPVRSEREDGIGTIRWISEQPFCNGSIGMYGLSYLGICQWAVIDGAPSSLKAIVPVNASSDLYRVIFPTIGSVHIDLVVRWLYLVFFVGEHNSLLVSRLFRRLRLHTASTAISYHLPMNDIDKRILGRELSFFKGAVKHREDPSHEFWAKDMQLRLCEDFNQCPPALLIAGWFDIFLQSQLKDWAMLQATSPQHSLMIGPWHHWQVKKMAPIVESAALSWLDMHLKNDHSLAVPRVRLYISGIDQWRSFSEFPFSPIKSTALFLNTNRGLSYTKSTSSQAIKFTYDPIKDPTPFIGGASFDARNAGSKEQMDFESREDVIVFTSDLVEKAMTVIGPISANLYVGSSVRSSDWVCRLCDVDLRMQSMNLCDGIERITTTVSDDSIIHQVHVDMWAVGHVFLPGHRIRIQICSGAHPRFSRNSGTGECDNANATSYLPADNTIHISDSCPSHVVLPCLVEDVGLAS